MQNWLAPALTDAGQAGVQRWPQADVVALLKTGVAPQVSVIGPMAEVVFRSTQYLSDATPAPWRLFAGAAQHAATPAKQAVAPASVMERGAKVYEAQCAQVPRRARAGLADEAGNPPSAPGGQPRRGAG